MNHSTPNELFNFNKYLNIYLDTIWLVCFLGQLVNENKCLICVLIIYLVCVHNQFFLITNAISMKWNLS